MLYKADILAICPQAKPEIVDAIVAAGAAVWQRFGVDTPAVQAKFMGQLAYESTSLTRLEENLNYTAQRLCQVWPKLFPALDTAQPYAHNPEKLANKVYGGRLGNTRAGDGWRYRGRGLIQLTGRDNYQKTGARIGIVLDEDPDMAARPEIAFLAALAWWQMHVGEKARTAGIEEITKIISGGAHGLAEREVLTERAMDVLVPGRLKSRTLTRGAKGNDVRLLQAQLVELGEDCMIDGIFGPITTAAVCYFQSQQNLPATGIYDETAILALELALLAQRNTRPPVLNPAAPDATDIVALAASAVRARYGDVMCQEQIALTDDQQAQLTRIKHVGLMFWGEIKGLAGREAALALTSAEQAVMWAEKSIINQLRKGT